MAFANHHAIHKRILTEQVTHTRAQHQPPRGSAARSALRLAGAQCAIEVDGVWCEGLAHHRGQQANGDLAGRICCLRPFQFGHSQDRGPVDVRLRSAGPSR